VLKQLSHPCRATGSLLAIKYGHSSSIVRPLSNTDMFMKCVKHSVESVKLNKHFLTASTYETWLEHSLMSRQVLIIELFLWQLFWKLESQC